jgi:hypothetical protein
MIFFNHTKGRKKSMSTQFDPALYRIRIIDQCFVESRQGTPGLSLTFKVIQNLDNPEAPVKSYKRSLTLWVSEKTRSRVMHQLHQLGYEGDTFTGVDPDTKGFHSFAETETDAVCAHESNDRGTFEQWTLASNGGGNKPQKLRDKSILRRLDGEEVDQGLVAPEADITDDDVPF